MMEASAQPAGNFPPQDEARIKAKIARYQKRKSRRSNFDAHWAEVIEYVIPNFHNTLYTNDDPGNRGEKKQARLFESTGVTCNELLASNLHGMLTSASSLFFGLSTGDPKLDAVDAVRLWLDDTALKMHAMLNNSNFQTEVHEVYGALGSLGTGFMLVEEDEEFDVRFQARPIFEAYIAENFQKMVDSVDRVIRMPLRQIEQEFGRLPEEIRKKIKDPEDELMVLHSIDPIEGKEYPDLKAKGFQFISCWLLIDHKFTLKESGFHEFPCVVPRWTRTLGEIYGRSPAMKVLPDIKMAQEMMKTTLRGGQLTVAPPYQMPDQGIVLPLKLTPNGQNYYRAGTQDRIEPLITNARVDYGLQLIENVQRKIREAFFLDQLQLGVGPMMTATETSFRKEDQQRTMGPILGRQHFELLRPLVARIYGIGSRRGKFEEPPDELDGRAIQPKYISQIARAQRTSDLGAFARTLQTIAPLATVQPEIMDNFNGDQITRDAAGITGLPASWLNDKRKIDGIRGDRAQAAQEVDNEASESAQVENVAKLAQAESAASAGRAAS